MEYKVAGIIRVSPSGKQERDDSIKGQRSHIEHFVKQYFSRLFPNDNYRIVWFVEENVSGDSNSRPVLQELFDSIGEYHFAFVRDVDRFSRSYLGLMWFHDYFLTDRGLKPHSGCRLMFCQGVGDLYNENGMLNVDSYMTFFFLCGIAQAELIRIRQRISAGRIRKGKVSKKKLLEEE